MTDLDTPVWGGLSLTLLFCSEISVSVMTRLVSVAANKAVVCNTLILLHELRAVNL